MDPLPDFITPQTALSAYDNTYNGATVDLGDAFVLKLDGTGSSLIYATLLGGPEETPPRGSRSTRSGGSS